jgi:type I restriction enzyme S subunit
MKAIETKQELPQGTYSPAVPLGCKQTDLGVIPEHWRIRQLADICMPRGIVRGPFGGTLKKDTFVTSGFKVYEQQNAIYKSFELGSYFVDQSKYAEMHRFSVSPDDFIISCSGTIGRIFQIPPDAPQGVINQALLKLTTDDEVVYDQYFYILFEWDEFQIRIIDSTQGGAIKNLVGMDVFRTITVALPPLSEQRAIAEVLSDVDGLLNALEALIAKKRAIKQATMQQLLTGKTRLPGFNGAWTEKLLSDLAVITMGQSPSSIFYNSSGEGLPLIQGNADIENRHTIERVWTTQGNKRCNLGDLILTVRAPVGAVAIASKNAFIGRGVCSLKPVGDSKFLFQSLVYAEDRWQTFEQGSTFTAANSEQVGQFRLCVPDNENEQRAIASVLSDMDAEITALEQRRDKTLAIKQGMMQQLLTGCVRLLKSE